MLGELRNVLRRLCLCCLTQQHKSRMSDSPLHASLSNFSFSVGSLKLAMVSVFTPQKLANPTAEGFFLFLRLLLNIYQHTTGLTCTHTLNQESRGSFP